MKMPTVPNRRYSRSISASERGREQPPAGRSREEPPAVLPRRHVHRRGAEQVRAPGDEEDTRPAWSSRDGRGTRPSATAASEGTGGTTFSTAASRARTA